MIERDRMVKRYQALVADVAPACLVAVSKTVDVGRIRVLLDAGHRVWGENRVQEAADKWQGLRGQYKGIELHFIGHLQTNKVGRAFELFDVIESLDRESLARACATEKNKRGMCPRLWVQVNVGGETQKGGVAVDSYHEFVAWLRGDMGLVVEGIMGIPPLGVDPVPYFERLAQLARDSAMGCISMGMSGDYKQAVARGATHVRLGTALFGARQG